ncbi:MAG: response regulator [Candidatus Omnitrophica bacterium]|nr:response regulator [Candidatus Omnitrophota bacterium]
MSLKKVLIVDDDEDLQILYGLYLQGESYSIERAYNGKEALEKIAKNKPDLIILDIIMPIMDGEEFYVKLRSQEPYKNIPVIIASVNEKMPHKIFQLGHVYAALKKPFSIETLVTKVREALAR